MRIASVWSDKPEVDEAIKELSAKLLIEMEQETPQFIAVFPSGKKYDGEAIHAQLVAAFPESQIWGVNSDVIGIPTVDGIKEGISLMGFNDPTLEVGVTTIDFDWTDQASYREKGKEAITKALEDAGKSSDDKPNVVLLAAPNLITATDIVTGIQDVTGTVPICGGNAGQQMGVSIIGDGFSLSTGAVKKSSISVAALWTKTKVGVAFGYALLEIPEAKGIVTKADPASRIVYEIDNRPAAEVYNEWTKGALDDLMEKGGVVPVQILGKYGLKKPVVQGSPDYVWIGILRVFPDKSVLVTHEPLEENTEVTLLQLQDEEDVINRTSIIGTVAMNRASIPQENVAGALLIYCYALLYTATGSNYDINLAFPTLSQMLGGAPIGGFFAGGEVGFSPHFGEQGNRMMAVSNVLAVFGKD